MHYASFLSVLYVYHKGQWRYQKLRKGMNFWTVTKTLYSSASLYIVLLERKWKSLYSVPLTSWVNLTNPECPGVIYFLVNTE